MLTKTAPVPGFTNTPIIIQAIDPNSSLYTYTYDPNNRDLLTATYPENVVYSFTYDTFGNHKTANVGDSTLFINTSADYTADGNYLKELTDASGNNVIYNWNQTSGTLSSMTDAKGNVTTYDNYDLRNRLGRVSKTVNGQTVENSYGYENDNLKTITHNGFTYTFDYDALGNNTNVSVGTQALVTNSYEQFATINTSKLTQSQYGNGQTIGYDYDHLDRIIAKRYNGSVRYQYLYDGSANLGVHTVLVNGVTFKYEYDLADRLQRIVKSNGDHNAQGDIIGLFNGFGTEVISYKYDSWGELISVTGSLASTVGQRNPYRYDTETGLYYLQSRYYNPEWGRFFNADAVLGLTGELLTYPV